MPRAFDPGERERILSLLVAAGKKLVNQKGLRSVTVAEAAREAGIAKGSFYAFFPSREDFLLTVLESWEQEFRTQLLEELASGPGGRTERWLRFFHGALAILDREPGLTRLGTADVQMFLQRLPPERVEAHRREDARVLEQTLGRMLASGTLDPRDAPAFPGITMALFAMVAFRDQFPPGGFDPAAQLMAEALALRFSHSSPGGRHV